MRSRTSSSTIARGDASGMRRSSVTVGGFLTTRMGPDLARYGGPRGSLRRGTGEVEPPKYVVMALRTVYEMACFFAAEVRWWMLL